MSRFYLAILLIHFTIAYPVEDRPLFAPTSSGLLLGQSLQTLLGPVHQFLGVRYAKPPTGNLRFRPSEPLQPLKPEVLVDARSYGPSCLQPDHQQDLMYPQLYRNESQQPTSEDCLFLNVFVPSSKSKQSSYPVIVWLPGEGFNYASGRQFDGSHLAVRGQVMVMTVNYRVSAFGFLSTGTEDAPGNAGLTDQINALKWVRENAAVFGGDPERVTLAGRFTGAMSITALLTSPMSAPNGKPLFQKVIIQSGIAGEKWTIDPEPVTAVRLLANKLQCESAMTITELVECLRAVDSKELLAESAFLHSWRLVTNPDLPQDPIEAIRSGKYLNVPGLIGYTDSEGSLCMQTHKVLKTPLLPKLLNDSLEEQDFTILAKSFFKDYLHTDDDHLAEEATMEYEKIPGSWRDRYLQFCGDGYIGHKTRSLAAQLSSDGTKVYFYKFSHRPKQSIHPEFIQGGHGDDLLFTFGLVHENEQSTSDEKRLSEAMMAAWTNFAKTSDPNPTGEADVEEWPLFNSGYYRRFSVANERNVEALVDGSVDKFWKMATGSGWKNAVDSGEEEIHNKV